MAPLFQNWIIKEPQVAINAFESLDHLLRAKVGPELIKSWTREQPEQAGEWLLSYKEPTQKIILVEALLNEWSKNDPISAYAWLGNIPEGNVRDVGIEQLIRREVHDDPERAMLWAFEISDKQLSESYVESIAQTYFSEE